MKMVDFAALFSRATETSLLSTEQYDSSAWSETVSGVRFIGIDNSTQLVTVEQASFAEGALAEAAAAGEPVVVIVRVDAVCFVYTCRRLIDLSLIAGINGDEFPITWDKDGNQYTGAGNFQTFLKESERNVESAPAILDFFPLKSQEL